MESSNLTRFLPRFSPIQWIAHLAGWLPLILLVIDHFSNNLTANPIQAATQRTGQSAVIFLLLSLACTPAVKLAGIRQVGKLRRPLGLFAFLYAGLHFLLFAWADFGWRLDLIGREILEKRYLWVGIPALLILFALAITSIKKIKRAMGKGWKTLHRLVYPASILVVLHMAWVSKGDLFSLSGDILKPLLAAVAALVLFGLRLPQLYALIARQRKRSQPNKPNPPTQNAE